MASGAVYDEIGQRYAEYRQPDPGIAALVADAVGPASSVVTIGSGTGSYDRAGPGDVAVEPSAVMIAQRRPTAAPVIQAVAERLPLRSRSFAVAVAVLTIHHWGDLTAGLGELRRVAERQVVLTFDPVPHCRHWLVEYVPELGELFGAAPAVDEVARLLGAQRVVPVPLAHDTPDGMTIAYWRRPEAYLDADRRRGGSALVQVDQAALARGLARLEADLADGTWQARYGHLLTQETMDYGLRLIIT
jgi:SAM-dependent methyltransferase